MTVSSVSVKRHESLNWYLVTVVSRKDGIGENRIEFWCTSEVLAGIRSQINQIMPLAEIPEAQKWKLAEAFRDAANAEKKDK